TTARHNSIGIAPNPLISCKSGDRLPILSIGALWGVAARKGLNYRVLSTARHFELWRAAKGVPHHPLPQPLACDELARDLYRRGAIAFGVRVDVVVREEKLASGRLEGGGEVDDGPAEFAGERVEVRRQRVRRRRVFEDRTGRKDEEHHRPVVGLG